ncbi:glycosyltransferase [Stutzerimonas azotifigens]|uniref:Glycosyltransferase family 1 protein n=1 Tax=Stutzerimonas azotifigens TaxID=291995 RepID=A0ABR5Z0L4_9GAMM|nr:glycosyltransferase [Stutzerimonas azotifigens]MBA1273720.1 glycosyltransferase family 1 protein [Stutzerimonas azotifigens]
MTHFAVIAPPFHSHLRALEAISSELIRRGHRLTFVQQADVCAALCHPALQFAAVGAASHPPGSMQAVISRAARPGGPWGLKRVIADLACATDMLCREAPLVLSTLGVEAVIADQMEPAGALVAESLGLPYVSVACALPFNREPLMPLPVMPWRYQATPWGEQLNLHSARVYDWMMRPHGDVIAAHAAAFGLAPRRTLSECLSPLLQVSQTPIDFDFPRQALPRHVHAVGPLRMPLQDEPPLTLPIETRRPFVFASFGTLQGYRFGLFQRIARACRELDVQLLVAHCGGLDHRQEQRLQKAGATWVTDFAPQRSVLANAQAVVTHAGLNTVLDALEAGVPVLALPIAFDQPGVAARVEYAGVGLRLNHRIARSSDICNALLRLLSEPAFHERASALGREVRVSGGAARAAYLIETAVRRNRPLTRDDDDL